jgi:hypothetical protein
VIHDLWKRGQAQGLGGMSGIDLTHPFGEVPTSDVCGEDGGPKWPPALRGTAVRSGSTGKAGKALTVG